MYRPPRPRSTVGADSSSWNGSRGSLPFSQVAPGRVDSDEPEGELDQSGIRSMRRWVIPPTSLHGRGADHLLNDELLNMEACNGAMVSGSYMDLLGSGAPDPTLPSDPRLSSDPTNHHARGTAKSFQGRSRNFRDEEDILLVSA